MLSDIINSMLGENIANNGRVAASFDWNNIGR
jgi:hypothetical protein